MGSCAGAGAAPRSGPASREGGARRERWQAGCWDQARARCAKRRQGGAGSASGGDQISDFGMESIGWVPCTGAEQEEERARRGPEDWGNGTPAGDLFSADLGATAPLAANASGMWSAQPEFFGLSDVGLSDSFSDSSDGEFSNASEQDPSGGSSDLDWDSSSWTSSSAVTSTAFGAPQYPAPGHVGTAMLAGGPRSEPSEDTGPSGGSGDADWSSSSWLSSSVASTSMGAPGGEVFPRAGLSEVGLVGKSFLTHPAYLESAVTTEGAEGLAGANIPVYQVEPGLQLRPAATGEPPDQSAVLATQPPDSLSWGARPSSHILHLQRPRPTPLPQPCTSTPEPRNQQNVAATTTMNLLIDTVERRDRTVEATNAVWECAQSLLREDTYVFDQRPMVCACDRGVFREAPKVRRPFAVGRNKWQNSGGKKGSTVWVSDTGKNIMRCSYGKVQRAHGPDLRYQEYTFTDDSEEPAHLRQRTLYVVVRNVATAGRKKTNVIETKGGKDPDQFSTPEVEEWIAHFDRQAAQMRDISVDAVATLLSEYDQPAMCDCNPVRHRRPLVRTDNERRIFVEVGSSKRRTKRSDAINADQWVNSGGKNAVVVVETSSGLRLHRRAGFIKSRSAESGAMIQHYHQYRLEDASSSERSLSSVTLYHVCGSREHKKPKVHKRKGVDPVLAGADLTAGRAAKRQTTASAKVSSAMAMSLVLLAVLMFSGVRSGVFVVSGDAACPQGYYSEARAPCRPCTDCSAHGLTTVAACTASRNAACSAPQWGWRTVASPASPSHWIDPDSGKSHSLHLPQMAAAWQSGSSLYAFGGSSDVTKVQLSHEEMAAGEECTTDAIGVSDDLWHFANSAGWTRVPHTSDDGGVWPRRRYAATSWSLAGSGLMFSGQFEFCRHKDYEMYEEPGVEIASPVWCAECRDYFPALAAKCPTQMKHCDWNCTVAMAHVLQKYGSAVNNTGLNPDAAAVFSCFLDGEPTNQQFIASMISSAIDKANSHLYFAPPDSLYLAVSTSTFSDQKDAAVPVPSWTLLGGSDAWQGWTATQLGAAVANGFSRTPSCDGGGSEPATCMWPLPRARAQSWTVGGVAYMFSGLASFVVDGSYSHSQTMPLLLNDLWAFDVNNVSRSTTNKGLAVRIAACSTTIEDPSTMPPLRQASGGKTGPPRNSVPYPGPRFDAATWGHEQSGFLFGGVGRRVSVFRGLQYGDNCNVDDITAGIVTNLCDMWKFTQGVGFTLLAACARDLPDLLLAGLEPATVVPMDSGPTAGIMATSWVSPTPWADHISGADHGASETVALSLWMFGGVTSCSPFNGVGPAGTVMPAYEDDATAFDNLTTCDLYSTKRSLEVAVVGAGFPDQLCSADLWRFDLSTEAWVAHPRPHEAVYGVEWPAATCGASSYLDGPGSDAQHGTDSFLATATGQTATLVGGWTGPGGGECEAWTGPGCSSHLVPSPKEAQPGKTTPLQRNTWDNAYDPDYIDGEEGQLGVPPNRCRFKSFESQQFSSQDFPPRTRRMRAATCTPLTESWRWGPEAATADQ